jgi:hypothetical protein
MFSFFLDHSLNTHCIEQATLGNFVVDSKWGDCAPNDDICVASDGTSVGDAVGAYTKHIVFINTIVTCKK